jgi:uncharacterized protein Usg
MVKKDAVSKDFRKQVVGYGLTTAENRVSPSGSPLAAAKLRLAGLRLFPNFPALKDFLASGKNHSKDPCSQSPLRTLNSSGQPNCTPSMVSFDCTDSTAPPTVWRT